MEKHPTSPHHFFTHRIWALLILFLATALFSLIYAVMVLPNAWGVKNKIKKSSNIKACTEEAKICPDGSSVGRSGPKCEFTPCPSPQKTMSVISYTSTTAPFKISYPSTWKAEEIINSEYGRGQTRGMKISGDEGSITMLWAKKDEPAGFGGGCDEKDKKTLTMKNYQTIICNGIAENREYWGQINYKGDEWNYSGYAESTPYVPEKSKVIQQILETISF